MKVTILPENIITFLPLINKVLPLRSQVPILSNVLLIADTAGFFIKATDLELGVEVKIPAKVEKNGATTVPGKEFIDAINSFPKDKILIELERDMVTMTSRDSKVSFNTIPREEFPKLYKEKGTEVARFTRNEFSDIFSYLTFSVSQEESRPQLTGVYVDQKDGFVNFVSTDGYRMSVKKAESKHEKIKTGLIVSVGLINEVIAMKGDDDIVLYVNKEENQIIFEVGDAVLIGRMIAGAFPDYERVLPSNSNTVIHVERDEMLQSVRLASVFAKDSSNIVNLEVIGNNIKLTTKAQGVGEGEAVVECKKEGEDNKIAFNIKYLTDILKTVSDKSLTLRFNSPSEPAVFEVKEKGFVHVIMPIQVD